MNTEAVFDNIADRIQQEIKKAQHSIFIAVAWFTNQNLFEVLVRKSEGGLNISLIVSNDEINKNSKIDFTRLNSKSSKVFKVGNGSENLMHNKFCVIDFNTVITGSYNWSYKAETNFENVVIYSGDTILAEQFVSEFNNIRKIYYNDEETKEALFPIDKIVKRLEILKNYIVLEDIEELVREKSKLEIYYFNSDIEKIIDNITLKEYSLAIRNIQEFITKNQQLSIWTNPEITGLKLEIKNLQLQLISYDYEKAELEKLLSDFQQRHTRELGEIILEILKLRKLKLKNEKEEDKYEEAKQDEKKYQQQYNIEKERVVNELSLDQEKELKNISRKAKLLCHPDKFQNESEEVKHLSEELFKELIKATDAKDIDKVKEIFSYLQKGILKTTEGDSLSDIEILRATAQKLKVKVNSLLNEIMIIKNSSTIKTINDIENWDEYFAENKSKLEQELENLRIEIGKNINLISEF